MTRYDEAVRHWFIRIVGGLTYILPGSLIFVWRVGPDLLGYNGAYAADMAESAFPILVVLWALLFPFFLLVGYLIDVLLISLGFDEYEIKLR